MDHLLHVLVFHAFHAKEMVLRFCLVQPMVLPEYKEGGYDCNRPKEE